jgi:uncharacterized protein (TIGR02996 family)
MNHEPGLLRSILDDPDDDDVRLIYADWLEDQSDLAHRERGEFVRSQIDLSRLPDHDPRRVLLLQRGRELLARHEAEWVGEMRGLVRTGRFRRGFLERVEMSAEVFLKRGAEIFDLAPVREVHLRGARGRLQEIGSCPHLARLQGLDLQNNILLDDDMADLMHSPHLGQLRRLGMANNEITCEGLRTLFAGVEMPDLYSLDLHLNRLRAETLLVLRDCGVLAPLEALDLRSNMLLDDGVEPLAKIKEPLALREFQLGGTALTAAGLDRLTRSCCLPDLTKLGLNWNDLGDAAVEQLTRSALGQQLVELDLSFTGLTNAIALHLQSWLGRMSLRVLDLHGNQIHDDAERLFARGKRPCLIRWRGSDTVEA